MSRKLLVAVSQDMCKEGRRRYTVLDKQGNVVERMWVYDCGHGAHIAYESFKRNYTISSADWALDLARKQRDKVEKEIEAKKTKELDQDYNNAQVTWQHSHEKEIESRSQQQNQQQQEP